MKTTNLRALYLDYFNNFLTVEKFAESYGLTLDVARQYLEMGKIEQEIYSQFHKSGFTDSVIASRADKVAHYLRSEGFQVYVIQDVKELKETGRSLWYLSKEGF